MTSERDKMLGGQPQDASDPALVAARPRARRTQESWRPVTIGADVWVGGACVILPGVRIGDGAAIGAGSVVTRDVPAGALAMGNPCRVRRQLG